MHEELPAWVITAVGGLCSTIVAMAMGFWRIMSEMKKELDECRDQQRKANEDTVEMLKQQLEAKNNRHETE